MRTTEEVVPQYAQQSREHVQPDMITLGSLSLQQVSATKRNICVIIPYSPAHQPCPLGCVSLVFFNGHNVHMCAHLAVYTHAWLSQIFFIYLLSQISIFAQTWYTDTWYNKITALILICQNDHLSFLYLELCCALLSRLFKSFFIQPFQEK